MPEIFVGGKFEIDALGLEDDADVSPHGSGLVHGVEAGDGGAAGSRDHERGQNSEESGLAAAVRAEQAKELGGSNIKRNAVKRGAILVAMDEIANGNDGLAGLFGVLGGMSEVNGS